GVAAAAESATAAATAARGPGIRMAAFGHRPYRRGTQALDPSNGVRDDVPPVRCYATERRRQATVASAAVRRSLVFLLCSILRTEARHVLRVATGQLQSRAGRHALRPLKSDGRPTFLKAVSIRLARPR